MLELPLPHKALWPNGRPHWATKARETKKHRAWAYAATLAHLGRHPINPEAKRFAILATFYPKTRHPIDEDNAVASLKAYQDGIAQAMKVDDRLFETPTVFFGEPVKGGKVVILIGQQVPG